MTMYDKTALGLKVCDERVLVSSRDVARVFGKLHKDVMKSIRNLYCSAEFNRRNFAPVGYRDEKGESRPEYLMTRDGFTFLAMGFSGEKAGQFKEAYINEFNRMEAELKNHQRFNNIPTSFSEALMLAGQLEEERVMLEAQNAVLLPKADVYDEHYGHEGDITPIVKFARTLEGVNTMKVKSCLMRLDYLYRLGRSGKTGTYRVYSKYRGEDNLFVEKFNEYSGHYDIYLTGKGTQLLTKLYKRKELTMKKGWC